MQRLRREETVTYRSWALFLVVAALLFCLSYRMGWREERRRLRRRLKQRLEELERQIKERRVT